LKLIICMFIKKIYFKNESYELFFTFCTTMKACDTEKQVTTQTNKKWYNGMIKSVTQHSYFEKKTQQVDG
jgi:L-rhamnose mutarotase